MDLLLLTYVKYLAAVSLIHRKFVTDIYLKYVVEAVANFELK